MAPHNGGNNGDAAKKLEHHPDVVKAEPKTADDVALEAAMDPAKRKYNIAKRQELAQRLLAHSTRHQTFFQKLQLKLAQNGVTVPNVTIEYKGLTVTTEAMMGAASIVTVGNLPIIAIKRMLGIGKRTSRQLDLVRNMQGRLEPARLTLLLGPPSTGKTTLMKALSGRIRPRTADLRVRGDVLYNGHTFDEFHVLRTAAYVEQYDMHNPNLTVRETLDFAHACQNGLHGGRFNVPLELARVRSKRLHAGDTAYSAAGAAAGTGPSAYPAGGGGSAYPLEAVTEEGGPASPSGPLGGARGSFAVPRRGSMARVGSMVGRVASSFARVGSGRNVSSLFGWGKQFAGIEAPEDDLEATLREAWGTRVRVDVVMALLGLSHCSETLVGDALVRGISGGERKRLTTAEMLVGPCGVLFLDEISTGLDSATLYTVIRWLSHATSSLQLTTTISLLQPPPEVFGLFDDILFMAEGQTLYHGPVRDAVSHFSAVGFACPARKDVPSYLLELTTPTGQLQYADTELRARKGLPMSGDLGFATESSLAFRRATASGQLSGELPWALPGAAPVSGASGGAADGSGRGGTAGLAARSGELGAAGGGAAPRSGGGGGDSRAQSGAPGGGAATAGSSLGLGRKMMLVPLTEMEQQFWTSDTHGIATARKLAGEPFDPARSPAGSLVPLGVGFALRPLESINMATRRQATLVLRDKVLLKGRTIQVIIISLLTGSLFFNQGVSLESARTLFGACFMSVLFMSFGGFVQLPITMELKRVWFKHRAAGFYPAYAQATAMALSQLPLSALESFLFSIIIYFMVNFYRSVGYWFTYWLILGTTSAVASGIFRLIACLTPNMVIANAVSGLLLVMLIITSGFAIVRESIPPWMIWAYWISPYSYALRSLVVNEMTSPKWQNVPAPPAMGDISLGDAALLSFDFFTERKWVWIGVGFLIGTFLLLTGAATFGLALLNPEVPGAQLPDEEALRKARQDADRRRRELAELRSRGGQAAATKEGAAAASGGKKGANGGTAAGGTNIVEVQMLPQIHENDNDEHEGQAQGSFTHRANQQQHLQHTEVADAGPNSHSARLVDPPATPAPANGANNAGTAPPPAPPAPPPPPPPPPTSASPFSAQAAQGGGTAAPAGANRTLSAGVKTVVLSPSLHHVSGRASGVEGAGGADAGESAEQIASAALADYIDLTSSLPFNPITLVFKDLWYTVPNPAYSRRAARKAAQEQQAAAQAAVNTHATDIEAGQGDAGAVAGEGDGAGGKSAVERHSANSAAAGARRSLQQTSLDKGSREAPGVGEAVAAVQLAAKEKLTLLSGVTGYAEPGVLLALMGGSGAGKTTLMDVIAGRKTIGQITGTIAINGHHADPKAWSRVVGYVEQMDIHSPATTVVEALQFSARLRLPASVSNEQVECYVEEVLDIVDLMPSMFSLVGSPGASGLSVEARKRLTIAVELVANPAVVFMDEPTSGLDARAAAIVMRAVRNVARNGRTVMVTIHQPSIDIFESFDNLLLIQRGGRTTYFGPLGVHSQDLIDYLMAVPGTMPLPSGFNPATWMLEVTGGSMATVIDRVDVDWPALYAHSDLYQKALVTADALMARDAKLWEPLHFNSEYAMPFWDQVVLLLRKFNRAWWRSAGYNFVRLGTTLSTSFVYAAVYWDEGRVPNPASMANVQNIMGIMFSSSNFLGMTNLMSIMPIVGLERTVFYRERGAAMYDPFAYGIAIALVEMPYLLVQACIFVPIMYFTIHFEQSPEEFFYYFIVFFETIAFYTIFGQFLVYCTPAQAIAQVVGGGLNFLFNIFNGFVITYPDIPKGWRWMNRVAPPTWILYGLGVSQLGNNHNELIYAGEPTTVSQFMIDRFGYHYSMRWWVLLILLAYISFVRVTSIIALKYWNFLRR